MLPTTRGSKEVTTSEAGKEMAAQRKEIPDVQKGLYDAILHQDLEWVADMVEKEGADVNYKWDNYVLGGYSALHQVAAVAHGTRGAEIAQYLLDQGADLYAKDSRGHTPADYALNSNDLNDPSKPEILEVFMEHHRKRALSHDGDGQQALHGSSDMQLPASNITGAVDHTRVIEHNPHQSR